MTTTLIHTPAVAVSPLSATEAARVRRDALLTAASEVTTISDRLDADCALPVLRDLKAFEREVEDEREAAKAPVLDLGRRIDGLAKELTAKVKIEYTRIARLAGDFEAKEREEAAEKQRKADEEAARIAFEAAEAERKAMAAAATPEAAARASDAIVTEAQVAIAEVRANVAPVVRSAGTTLRQRVCFEVTDVRALFKARPDLIDLVPNDGNIRAQLTAAPDLQLPGVRRWKENALGAR